MPSYKRRQFLAQQVARLDELDAGLRDADYTAIEETRALLRNAVSNADAQDLRVLILSLRAAVQRELRGGRASSDT